MLGPKLGSICVPFQIKECAFWDYDVQGSRIWGIYMAHFVDYLALGGMCSHLMPFELDLGYYRGFCMYL